MYYINKIVGFIFSPLGIAIFGGVAAVVCARLKRMRLAKWIGGATAVWLWLWMTPLMTCIVGVPLENEFLNDGRVSAVKDFPDADAIVLLGGSMGFNDELGSHSEMSASADRVRQAARLWKAGKAPKIIATGDGARESTLELLKEMGVKEECVEFVDARNTEEEAKRVWKSLSHAIHEKGVEKSEKARNGRVLMVTSAWHTKRARLMFAKYASGVDVVCAPADFEMTMAFRNTSFWKFLGVDAYTFHLNSVAFHEWVGLVGYWVFR